MKGKVPLFAPLPATPLRISELEEFFEINRDKTKISKRRKYVEEYGQAVQAKATCDQTILR